MKVHLLMAKQDLLSSSSQTTMLKEQPYHQVSQILITIREEPTDFWGESFIPTGYQALFFWEYHILGAKCSWYKGVSFGFCT